MRVAGRREIGAYSPKPGEFTSLGKNLFGALLQRRVGQRRTLMQIEIQYALQVKFKSKLAVPSDGGYAMAWTIGKRLSL